MKRLLFIGMTIFFLPALHAAPSGLYCKVVQKSDTSEFLCLDDNLKTFHRYSVAPIKETELIRFLKERGVKIVSEKEYKTIFSRSNRWEEKAVGFKISEFNNLGADDPTIARVKQLATTLHSAGVCKLKVKKQVFNNIDIGNSDDLIRHFLCISNSESTFGRDNIGQGGRGPWGINPIHNKSGGACYPGQAVVRDDKGKEIKDSKLYENPEIILANAQCAMNLYKNSGFKDWGTSSAWGSNRHCSKPNRDRLQFMKYIGELACCSEACKEKAREDYEPTSLDVKYEAPTDSPEESTNREL